MSASEIRNLVGLLHQLDSAVRQLEAERESLQQESRSLAPPALELTDLSRLLGMAEVNAATARPGPTPGQVQSEIDQAREQHRQARERAEQRSREIEARLAEIPTELAALSWRRKPIQDAFQAECRGTLTAMRDAALVRYGELRGAVGQAFADAVVASTLLAEFGGGGGASLTGVMVLPGLASGELDDVRIGSQERAVHEKTSQLRSQFYERNPQ